MTIIALEGIDGTGKTSILKALEKKYKNDKHIIFIKSPAHPFSELVSDFWDSPPFVRMMFFLLSNYHMSKNVNKHKIYILDRYTYSTFVTHLKNIGRIKIKSEFKKMNIEQPDKTFLIKANIEEINKRLQVRNNEIDNSLNIKELYSLYYKNKDQNIFNIEILINNNEDDFFRNISVISAYIDMHQTIAAATKLF